MTALSRENNKPNNQALQVRKQASQAQTGADKLRRIHQEIEISTRALELEKRKLGKLIEDVRRAKVELDMHRLPKKNRGGGSRANQSTQSSKEEDEGGKLKQALDALNAAPGEAEREFLKRCSPAAMKILEENLSKSKTRLDRLKANINSVKKKVDISRKERNQLNQGFKKVIESIKEKTRQVGGINTDLKMQVHAMDDAKNKLATTEKTMHNSRQGFKSKFMGLKDELQTSQKQIKEMEVKMISDKTGGGANGDFVVASEEDSFSDMVMMQRILKLAFLNTIQRRHIKQHQKNIEVFEQAFSTIKATTGITDIEEIVNIFVKLESRNYSLLNYNNQLNSDIEKLETANRELKDLISTHQNCEQTASKARKLALSDFESQLENANVSIKSTESEYTEKTEAIKQIGPNVAKVARCINAAQNRVLQISGKVKTENLEEHSSNEHQTGEFINPLPAHEWIPSNMSDSMNVLSFIERSLNRLRDFVPGGSRAQPLSLNLLPSDKYLPPPESARSIAQEISESVKAIGPKRNFDTGVAIPPLLRPNDLPTADVVEDEIDGDSQAIEDEYTNRVLTTHEIRQKAIDAVEKRRNKISALKRRSVNTPATGSKKQTSTRVAIEGDLTNKKASRREDDKHDSSTTSTSTDESVAGASEIDSETDNINEIFLKRYNMTQDELQAMAETMGIQLTNLCYLKQEFDSYDEDKSGYIDRIELKGLLNKLGEELTDEELDTAFKELDADGSGEIEFFEFVEWFTSE